MLKFMRSSWQGGNLIRIIAMKIYIEYIEKRQMETTSRYLFIYLF